MITDGAPVSWAGMTYVASDDWLSQGPSSSASASVGFPNPDSLCRIALTSGTTAGVPKAIGMSARVVEDRIGLRRLTLTAAPWDRMLVLPILSSTSGFLSALQALADGHTIVFASSALEALQLINLFAVDLLIANPQQLKTMVAVHQTNPIPTPSLKLIRFSGEALALALISEVRARFCNKILCDFGSTESGPIAFGLVDRLLDVPGAAGYLAPWAELEVIGENGEALPVGSEGILRLRTNLQGADLLQGPASDAESQWIYSGDYGKILPDGMVVLSGRVSDLIRVSGKFVFPEPIEQALASYPGVEEAAALGRPSASGRHEFWIAIKANGPIDTEAVKTYLTSRNPDWIVTGVTLVDAMPRNDMGKLVRQRLREQLPVR
jgi:acyl-coenzyme A synthetase/AMP-(fatty) acid ligase